MSKRILLMAMVLFAFAFIGCRETEQQQDYPKLPSLHITMTSKELDSILADRDNKVAAFALIIDSNGDTLYEGNLIYIKTRGNTSFKEPKKPFAIKFPQKQYLFGLERSKTYILLANACDESYIRNAIGLDLARAFGIPASRYAYFSLYINDSYKGLYQLTNKVDVGGYLRITNLEKLNELANSKPCEEFEWFGYGRKKQVIQRKGVLLDRNPDDITGGYLLDNTGPIPAYTREISGFASNANDNIRIRSPKYASPQEVEYIAKRYNEMESAVLAADGINHETGLHYTHYIDVKSFARYYLLNELLLNWDGGWSSFMMYKDTDTKDSKIYAGPAWDFDRTLYNPNFQGNEIIMFNELYVNKKKGQPGVSHSGGLLYHLCKHEDFRQEVRNCYLNEISSVCHNYLSENTIDSLVTLLFHEADKDNSIYNIRKSKDYKTATSIATDFLRERIDFFDWYYSSTEEERVLVTYKMSNGEIRRFYYPIEKTIDAPQSKKLYNKAPVYELYYAGTDSIVPKGTVFHSAQVLELRKREPTKREVQIRRIRKKLTKIGVIKN